MAAKKQLTELEQAIADVKSAQKVHGTRQAALAKAFDAEQQAAVVVQQARQRVQEVMAKEARDAALATRAAVGQQAPSPRRPARPAAQQQLAGAESNGHQAVA